MNNYLRFGIVLFSIAAITCGMLAWVNQKTAPLIQANQKIAQDNARKEVIPFADSFVEIITDNLTYYKAISHDSTTIGYTFLATGKGYSGDIETMVGMIYDENYELKINQIAIIKQTETPGLGANCTKPEFLSKFADKRKNELLVNKDGGNIDSLTGATITSRTITNSIKLYIDKLENILNGGIDEDD